MVCPMPPFFSCFFSFIFVCNRSKSGRPPPGVEAGMQQALSCFHIEKMFAQAQQMDPHGRTPNILLGITKCFVLQMLFLFPFRFFRPVITPHPCVVFLPTDFSGG